MNPDRVTYEHYSRTLRVLPQNYLIAYRDSRSWRRWTWDMDGAIFSLSDFADIMRRAREMMPDIDAAYPIELPPLNKEEIDAATDKKVNRYIAAIKMYRARTFCGLKEAKDAVDKVREMNGM